MQAKPKSAQSELFKTPLAKIIKIRHPLCILASRINWTGLDNTFGTLYSEGKGRPAKPTRLMVGPALLKTHIQFK